ncbi:MAG: hypothetical protein JXA97_09770 [Anaerolineales bacterium]|nr:hypothetical protein [Anaerolineales bacterium]
MRNENEGVAGPLIMALVAFSAGMFIVLMAIGVIAVSEESILVPRWILLLVGAAFTLAAFAITIDALIGIWPGGRELLLVAKGVIVFLLMISFAVPFHWIAFGSGERTFTSTVSGPVVSVSGDGSQLGGRIMFGAAAVMMDVVFIFLGIRSLRAWLKGEDSPQNTL